MKGTVSPTAFFRRLTWIDGRPLLQVIEPYRRKLFAQFHERDDAGRPRCNLGLFGRSKKNWKTTDLVLDGLYALLTDSPHGNQCYLIANDKDQAADDLELAKRLVDANPLLQDWMLVRANRIERRDGRGFLEVLAAGDAIGLHGKTYRWLGCDEIHGWRNWDVLEALQPDPLRLDSQTWITSYASIYHRPGVPLFDLFQRGKAGSDPRMLFSWYAADFCTDPTLATADPEARANPSRRSWADAEYLEQQRRRLPAHKFRRLHLNLPGLPEGAAFAAEPVMDAFARGVSVRPPEPAIVYRGFVDMSGGSSDDAVLAIGHRDADGRAVLDAIVDQGPRPPFDPNKAVSRFVGKLREYRIGRVVGDRYAGETFRRQFEAQGITYTVAGQSKSELYEAMEPRLNSHSVVLLDVPTLEQQLLGLVWRGGRIDHQSGEHDDFGNAVAGVVGELATTAPAWSTASVAAFGNDIDMGQRASAWGGPAHHWRP